jgi:type 1 glutamine amidotransferase
MRLVLSLVTLAGLVALAGPPASASFEVSAVAADPKPANNRLLLVTHSGGFIHDSVGVAEDVLKATGPQNGFDVTCWRFTGDPDKKVKAGGKKGEPAAETTWLERYSGEFRAKTGYTVGKENIGRLNKDTLKNFDCVLFFTTGSKRNGQSPLTDEELADLLEWVKAGGAFAGTHCATDTLYDTPYGDLVGGFFVNHPWHQKIKLKVEDAKHPAAAGFETGAEITDEIYQFTDSPYSREKLRIILSVDNSSIDTNHKLVTRKDKDFAIAWCQEYGKGKSFYTSLGHRKEVWKDERFRKHLFGGLKWAVGLVPGDATPSGKK